MSERIVSTSVRRGAFSAGDSNKPTAVGSKPFTGLRARDARIGEVSLGWDGSGSTNSAATSRAVGSVSSVHRLSADQERDLVNAAEAGGADARRELVDAFLPSIAALARHYPRGIGVE